MSYYTDAQIAAVFPSVAAMTPDEVAQTSDDVAALYGYVGTHAGIDDATLRGWALSSGMTVDRTNNALLLLRDAGKVFEIPDPGPIQAPR